MTGIAGVTLLVAVADAVPSFVITGYSKQSARQRWTACEWRDRRGRIDSAVVAR